LFYEFRLDIRQIQITQLMVLDIANEIVRMSAALRDKTATHGMYCLIPVVEIVAVLHTHKAPRRDF
ncbi:hypothetical protein, partial [Pseudomonas veronii]